MIEAGQADLMLISYLGVDLLNRGERVYRLLGCELTYHGDLPRAGDTLRFGIHLDGHAAQGAVRLMFFHYDCTNGDRLQLTVRKGQAGFFTDAELAASAGCLWSPEEQAIVAAAASRAARRPVREDAASRGKTSTRSPRRRVRLLRPGLREGADAHPQPAHPGRADAPPGSRHRPRRRGRTVGPRVPARGARRPPRPLVLRRPLQERPVHARNADVRGVPAGDGVLPRGARLHPAAGRLAVPARPRAAVPAPVPRPGHPVLAPRSSPRSSSRRSSTGPVPTLFADLLCTVDGLKAFHARRVALELVPDWPLEAMPALLAEAAADTRPAAEVDGFRFDQASLLACAWGKPSKAFGPIYTRFDGPARVARLPGPPYLFMSRVTEVDGPIGVMKPGASVTVEYDVPADAWYFGENGCRTMPFAVLLEAALQPCGWLSSYVGSALSVDEELGFRNLDGTGTLLGEVFPDYRHAHDAREAERRLGHRDDDHRVVRGDLLRGREAGLRDEDRLRLLPAGRAREPGRAARSSTSTASSSSGRATSSST